MSTRDESFEKLAMPHLDAVIELHTSATNKHDPQDEFYRKPSREWRQSGNKTEGAKQAAENDQKSRVPAYVFLCRMVFHRCVSLHARSEVALLIFPALLPHEHYSD